MALFHINLSTGNVLECPTIRECQLGLEREEHYNSYEEALLARDVQLSVIHSSSRIVPTDDEFDEALAQAVQGGFVKAYTDTPELYEAQLELLLTPTAIKHLSEELSISSNNTFRDRVARVLAWVAVTKSLREGISEREAMSKYVDGYLRTRSAQDLVQRALRENFFEESELLSVGANLWLYRHTRFHNLAKSFLFSDLTEVTGYTPKSENSLIEVCNANTLEKMKIEKESLKDEVLAFDVETDTSNGFGLRPRLAQITEVVVSSKDVSWILSGDERFILEQFAELVNSLSDGSQLVGWNNRCFDNIALQTRAEFHKIAGWRGVLEPVDNVSVFEPAGPTLEAQSLLWKSSDGSLSTDVDAFQRKVALDRAVGNRYTLGLKRYVESFGARPIKVDRQKLHELSDSERQSYVLSDGLSTLAAWSEISKTDSVYTV